MTEEIIIDGVDVSKGNQKYAEKYSPVEGWYKAENNMLDGINVAECVHFTRQYNYGYCELSNDSCNEFQYNCAKNKNCYYKQLKRLEQEKKELSFTIEKCLENAGIECDDEEQVLRSLSMLGNAHYKILVEKEELEQENRELKENLLDKYSPRYYDIVPKRQTVELYNKFDNLKNQNNTLRSALEEIRDNFMLFRSCMIPFHIGSKETLPHSMADAIQDYCDSIKNEINEVLGNESKQNNNTNPYEVEHT